LQNREFQPMAGTPYSPWIAKSAIPKLDWGATHIFQVVA